MRRRTLLHWLLLLPLSYPLVRWAILRGQRKEIASWRQEIRVLADAHGGDLEALARALLPAELGQSRAGAYAKEFVAWLEAQNPEAELNHLAFRKGGANAKEFQPGTKRPMVPVTNYLRQLADLRQKAGSKKLQALRREEVAGMARSALRFSGANEIPPVPDGANLLLDILSFAYRRGNAPDLFHGRRIAAMTCRGLDGVDQEPR